tara:strand:- start:103 stop:450 length:348 start_codon:yes stop_codon:yes gene_type:complete
LDKKTRFGVKVSPAEAKAFSEMAKQNMDFCKRLMFDHFIGQNNYSEEDFFEITKLYSNSYLFLEYLSKLIKTKKLDVENLYSLETDEVLNVSKCVIALVESKQELKDRGIHLSLQ